MDKTTSHLKRYKFTHQHPLDAKLSVCTFVKWSCWTDTDEHCMVCAKTNLSSVTYEVTMEWENGDTEYIKEVCSSCMTCLKSEYGKVDTDQPIDDRHSVKTLNANVAFSAKAVDNIIKIQEINEKPSQPVTFLIDLYAIQDGEKRKVHTVLHPMNTIYKWRKGKGEHTFELRPPTVDEYGYHYDLGIDYTWYPPSLARGKDDIYVVQGVPITTLIAEYKFCGHKANIPFHYIHIISSDTIKWNSEYSKMNYQIGDMLDLTLVCS
jgi:hypothetical protein